MNMNKKIGIAALLIAILALCLSVVSMAMARKPAEAEVRDIQYVLFLGTNGKDTNEPVFSPDEAKSRAEEVLVRHFGGYTIQEANGGWIGDDGTTYQEYTLVIYLSDTKLDNVHTVCDELIRVFHQSSVLIQSNQTTTEFYSAQ